VTTHDGAQRWWDDPADVEAHIMDEYRSKTGVFEMNIWFIIALGCAVGCGILKLAETFLGQVASKPYTAIRTGASSAGVTSCIFIPRDVAERHNWLDGEIDPIGDEYCWMHSPGGWTCRECRVAGEEDDMERQEAIRRETEHGLRYDIMDDSSIHDGIEDIGEDFQEF
jgi:hypothetical protein